MAELPIGWNDRTASIKAPPSHAALNTTWSSGKGLLQSRTTPKGPDRNGHKIDRKSFGPSKAPSTRNPGPSTQTANVTFTEAPRRSEPIKSEGLASEKIQLKRIEEKLSLIALSLANLTNKMQNTVLSEIKNENQETKDMGSFVQIRDAKFFLAGVFTVAAGGALYLATKRK